MDYQDFTDVCTINICAILKLDYTQFDIFFFKPCKSNYHCIVRVYISPIDIDTLTILKQAFTDFKPTILISTGKGFFDFDFLFLNKDCSIHN